MSRVLIQNYLAELSKLRQVSGSDREGVVSEAFKDLLKGWGRAHDLTFVPQYEIESPAKERRYGRSSSYSRWVSSQIGTSGPTTIAPRVSEQEFSFLSTVTMPMYCVLHMSPIAPSLRTLSTQRLSGRAL